MLTCTTWGLTGCWPEIVTFLGLVSCKRVDPWNESGIKWYGFNRLNNQRLPESSLGPSKTNLTEQADVFFGKNLSRWLKTTLFWVFFPKLGRMPSQFHELCFFRGGENHQQKKMFGKILIFDHSWLFLAQARKWPRNQKRFSVKILCPAYMWRPKKPLSKWRQWRAKISIDRTVTWTWNMEQVSPRISGT